MKLSLFGDVWCVTNAQIELDKALTNSDLTLLNLENPITESISAINKIGPNLKGNRNTFLKIMKQFSGIKYVSLANNHIMDYGKQGALDTVEACKQSHALYSGIGESIDFSPVTIEKEHNKIAIISICEKQFQSAQIGKFGVKCFTPEIYSQILKLKAQGCFVIISYHQGAEHLRWPSPRYQDIMRSFIDVGADIIHGHHSHVPQGYEEYKNGLIFYGMGNFIVPTNRWQGKDYLWSISANLTIENNTIKNYKIIPCQIIKTESITVEPLNSLYVQNYIESCNNPLNDRTLLESLWQEFSMNIYENRFQYSLGHRLGKITHKEKYKKAFKHFVSFILGKEKTLIKNFLSQYKNLIYYHYSSCEAHQHAIETALGIKCNEIKDLRSNTSRELFNHFLSSQ